MIGDDLPLFIELEINNSTATSDSKDEQIEKVDFVNEITSRSTPYVIDLDTTSDYPHHNITIYGADNKDNTSYSIASGDVNGDLINDLILGTPYAEGPNNNRFRCGEVYVIFGNSTPSPMIYLNSQPDVIFYGIDPGDWLGSAIVTGDVNGDYIDDILISAPNSDGETNYKVGINSS